MVYHENVGPVTLLEILEEHFRQSQEAQKKEREWHREYGASMRAHRLEAGLGLREVSRLIHFTPSFISDLENGNSPWNLAVARLYLHALEVHRVPTPL